MKKRVFEMPKKMTSAEIELRLARHFGVRKNVVVPNVSWGLDFGHELDLIVVSKAGYATEIEIKVSKADLKNDLKKPHKHESKRLKYLYFALPSKLKSAALEFVPERAGIILLNNTDAELPAYDIEVLRPAVVRPKAEKLTDKEIIKLHHLSAMRLWPLKANLLQAQQRAKILRSNLETVLPVMAIFKRVMQDKALTPAQAELFPQLVKLYESGKKQSRGNFEAT